MIPIWRIKSTIPTACKNTIGIPKTDYDRRKMENTRKTASRIARILIITLRFWASLDYAMSIGYKSVFARSTGWNHCAIMFYSFSDCRCSVKGPAAQRVLPLWSESTILEDSSSIHDLLRFQFFPGLSSRVNYTGVWDVYVALAISACLPTDNSFGTPPASTQSTIYNYWEFIIDREWYAS